MDLYTRSAFLASRLVTTHKRLHSTPQRRSSLIVCVILSRAGHARPATSPLYRFNLQFVGEGFVPPVHLPVQPLTWFIL